MDTVDHILLGTNPGPVLLSVHVLSLNDTRLRVSSSITGKITVLIPQKDCLTTLKRVPGVDIAGQLSFTQQFVDRILLCVKNYDHRL